MAQEHDRVPLDELLKSLLAAAETEAEASDTSDDSAAKEEQRDLESEAKAVAIEGQRQDIAERKKYARWIYFLIVGWLVALFVTIFAQGVQIRLWGWVAIDFQLPNSVLNTLIGGTTLSVLGIFVIVANYLFPKQPPT